VYLFIFVACINSLWVGLYQSATEGERMKVRYRVHRFDIDMTKDQRNLEQFLNNLEGEVVAIIQALIPSLPLGEWVPR